MKILVTILLAAAIVVVGAFWVNGQRELASLRDSNAALARQIAAASPASTVAADRAEAASSGGLSPEDQTELLRLRGEIQPLRRQVRDLSNQVASATKQAVPAR